MATQGPQNIDAMKLGVISLGCDKATVDSERLVAELVGHGAVVTPDLPRADVILVNTCGFIDAAKRESIDAMLAAAKLKADGAVKAFFFQAEDGIRYLIVTGVQT